MGHDLRLSGDVACGAALVVQGRVVHLNAFPSHASSNAVGMFPFALGDRWNGQENIGSFVSLAKSGELQFPWNAYDYGAE